MVYVPHALIDYRSTAQPSTVERSRAVSLLRRAFMSDDSNLYDVLCYGTISVENVTHLPFLPTPRRDAPAQSES